MKTLIYRDLGHGMLKNLSLLWDDFVEKQNPPPYKNRLGWPNEIIMSEKDYKEFSSFATPWHRGVPVKQIVNK